MIETVRRPALEPVWKMIYLARRNPMLAAADFPQAWREHSALGRQCRNVGQRVKSVAQCSRVLDAPLAGASPDYDGFNLLVLADRESAAAIWSDPETLAVMRPDEPRVFDRYVRECSLVCRESVLREAPRTGVVLAGFLRRRADLRPHDFRLSVLAAGPTRLLASGPLGQARRIVYNEVVETPPPGYEFDAIVEWWFESVAELQELMAGEDLRERLPPSIRRLIREGDSVFMLSTVTHQRP